MITMISQNLYSKILESGLLMDHFHILCNLRDGKENVKNKRIQGFINLLCKKGYIQDEKLTEKALLLLEEVEPISTSVTSTTTLPTKRLITESPYFGSWVVELHKKCQKKLLDAKGKPQVRGTLDGKSYPFLPNSTDLGKVLLRVIRSYKLYDHQNIEKTILSYIDSSIAKDNWFPVVNYYIMKGDFSRMVTDMESSDSESKTDDTIVNI